MRRITKLSGMLLLLLMTAWTQMFAAGTEPPFNQTQALKASEIVAGKEIALWAVNKNAVNFWYKGVNGSRDANLSDATTFIVENADNGNIYLKRKSDGKYMQYPNANTTANWVETSDEATAFVAKRPGTVEGGDNKTFNYTTDGDLSTPPSWDPNYEYLVRFAVASDNSTFINGNTVFGTGTGNWSAFLVRDVNSIVIPFTATTIESNQFKNATWYRIAIHTTASMRHYWKYDAENSRVVLTNTTDEDNFNVFSDDQLFCFVYTNNKDIKIYNKAAGTSKWITYDESEVSVGSGETETGTWSLTPSSVDASKFCFKTNKPDVTECYINNIGGTQLDYWHSNDDGSTCYFIETDLQEGITELTTTLKDKLTSIEGIIGFVGAPMSKESIESAISAFEANPTKDSYDKAMAEFENIIQVESGKYYRVINADYATRETRNYLSFTADGNGQLQPVEGESITAFNDPQTLFQIVQNENKSYSMKLQGKLIGNTQGDSKPVYLTGYGADQGTYSAGTYNLEEKATACYLLRCSNPTTTGTNGNKVCITMLSSNNGFSVSTWGDGVKYSQWYIQPVTSIDVAISDAGYATANYPFAVQLPENGSIKAYTGEVINSTTFALTEVPEGKIPANTPVVLSGAKNTTYTLTIDTENTESPIEGSDLSGTLLPETIAAEKTVYGLANGNSGVGFYMLNDAEGANRTIGANKAYLTADKLTEEAQGVRGLVFSFSDDNGTTTGIESSVSETAKEEYYDLQGRRVMNPSKGIYVTKSGKKILFTK